MKSVAFSLLAMVGFALVGCTAEAPKTEAARDTLHDQVQASLQKMEAKDPGLRDFLDRSAGYAIFPSIGKGGAIVGGAFGRGEVYVNGRMIGYCELSQGTVGAQIGGQTYSEIVAFENDQALSKFKAGKFAITADASAVALKAGAAAEARFSHGIAVFVHSEGGAMLEASVGGQNLSYTPNGATNMSVDEDRNSNNNNTHRSSTEYRSRTETNTDVNR